MPDGSLVGAKSMAHARWDPVFSMGIAFDAYGNLWATMIFADRLAAITPEGEVLTCSRTATAMRWRVSTPNSTAVRP